MKTASKPARKTLWLISSLLACSALLCGCEEKKSLAWMGGYNHMNDWGIRWFSVDGATGSNLTPESGETGSKCCASIPAKWYPGMKVKVRWGYDTTQGGPRPPPDQEAIVEIPEYSSRDGNIQAHFYPHHQVKVVISTYGIGHPHYPMSEQDKWPWKTRKDLLEDEKNGRLPL